MSSTGGTEAALSAIGVRQFLHFAESGGENRSDYQLGNALAGLNRKGKIMDQIGQILLMGKGQMFNIQHISPEKNNVRFRHQPERIACERNIGT